jgi:hypothetical protein
MESETRGNERWRMNGRCGLTAEWFDYRRGFARSILKDRRCNECQETESTVKRVTDCGIEEARPIGCAEEKTANVGGRRSVLVEMDG